MCKDFYRAEELKIDPYVFQRLAWPCSAASQQGKKVLHHVVSGHTAA